MSNSPNEYEFCINYIKSSIVDKIKSAKAGNTSKSHWDTYNFFSGSS